VPEAALLQIAAEWRWERWLPTGGEALDSGCRGGRRGEVAFSLVPALVVGQPPSVEECGVLPQGLAPVTVADLSPVFGPELADADEEIGPVRGAVGVLDS